MTTDTIFVQSHVDDWHSLSKKFPVDRIIRLVKVTFDFNVHAAVSAPNSIRFRQFDKDFTLHTKMGNAEIKAGDYILMDRSGGRMHVPHNIFKIVT